MKSKQSDKLNESLVYEILKETFPSQNDYFQSDYNEELSELKHFGIMTLIDLRNLLQKHRSQVLEIDDSPIDKQNEKIYREKYGDAEIDENLEDGYWFAYPALLSLALELEFGEKYEEFTETRDGM